MTPYNFRLMYPFSLNGNIIPGCRLVFQAEGGCRKGETQCWVAITLINQKPKQAGGNSKFLDWLYQCLLTHSAKLPDRMMGQAGNITYTHRGIKISFHLDKDKSESGLTAVEEARVCLVGLQQWVANLIPSFRSSGRE